MGHLFPPVLESHLRQPPKQSQHRLMLISLKEKQRGGRPWWPCGREGENTEGQGVAQKAHVASHTIC